MPAGPAVVGRRGFASKRVRERRSRSSPAGTLHPYVRGPRSILPTPTYVHAAVVGRTSRGSFLFYSTQGGYLLAIAVDIRRYLISLLRHTRAGMSRASSPATRLIRSPAPVPRRQGRDLAVYLTNGFKRLPDASKTRSDTLHEIAPRGLAPWRHLFPPTVFDTRHHPAVHVYTSTTVLRPRSFAMYALLCSPF